MLIGVLSDTHIPQKAKTLPKIVLKTFQDVDHIIHAGDIISENVIKQLEEIAPVTAVWGNIDPPELVVTLKDKEVHTFGGFQFGIFHGHGERGKTLDRAIKSFENHKVDVIIFGHSHIPYCQYHGDTLLFNPGSPTDKRKNQYYSFGLIQVHKTITSQLVYFDDNGIVYDPGKDKKTV